MRRRLPEPEWIAIGGADRSAGRLDGAPGPARSGADIAADIAAAGGPWMLTGGEPTLRADLPALLSGGGGIRTDGLPLAQPGDLAARGVALRRLGAQGAAAADFIALSPRLGLLAAPLEAAMAAADAAGIPAWTEGVPACMAPPERLRATPQARAPGCADCPADCPGYPADYAERLGFAELLRVSALPARARLRVVIAPDEDTRDVRRRLVAAAMYRPETLRVVGAAEHPARVELLRELLRLSVPRVELCGLLDGLASLPPADRLRLRGFARIDAALLGTTAEAHDAAVGRPGAFAATRSLKEAGCYGIVRSAAEAAAHVAAGVTDLRLAASGGALADLSGIPALAPLIPPCLGGVGGSPPVDEGLPVLPAGQRRSPHDRIGEQLPCPHSSGCAAAARCPGLAAGWDDAGIAPLLTPGDPPPSAVGSRA